jgi:phage shock protein A
LLENEQRTIDAVQKLRTKVDSLGVQKQSLRAKYTAAQAMAGINEHLAGISGVFEDGGMAMQRMHDKTAALQARAGALDELMASGALPDFVGNTDPLTRELDSIAAQNSVDTELASMRAAITAEPAAVHAR